MSWVVLGFDRDVGSLTHKVHLDVALAALLHIPAGESGPHAISPEAVRTLGAILSVPIDPDRSRFVVEHRPPVGWVAREIDADGPAEEIDVEWELIPVFAEILGEDADYLRGEGYVASFPLGPTMFEHVKRLFGLDVDFDDAGWFLEIVACRSLGA